MTKELAKLKIELFCQGIKIDKEILGGKGRESGAGPAGGRFLKLKEDIIGNIPTWASFTDKSPFYLKNINKSMELWKNNQKIMDITLLPSKYNFYEKKTSTNKLMKKVALIHGENCLATTVIQRCYYWRTNQQCVFCGIEGSLKNKDTIAKKKPVELFETTQAAINEGVCKHLTLTTGTVNSSDRGALYMEKVIKKINPLKVPIHVQVEPPKDFKWFNRLYEAGAKTIGIHVETLDKEIFKKYCPGKSLNTSIENFMNAWHYCVDLFGKNQVDTYYLIGLEDNKEGLIENIEKVANLEVIPFLVPIRPITGSKIDKFKKFKSHELIEIYSILGKIIHKNKLDPFKNKAGCVRCNACSAVKEAYKYLS